MPILRSRDLVSWTIVAHALAEVPGRRYDGVGIWAPALREHAGTFHIFAPTPDEGIYVLTAPRPEGPWSAPRLLLAGRGIIDPCPFWDDDGRAYLVHAYAFSRSGQKHKLRVRPMAPDASSVLGDGQIVFEAPARHPTIEGPKLYKREGWYYILAPAGGVPRGWQVALRARRIFGPYEDRVVLEQGATSINGPHQGALVDTPTGEWWFVHFQDAGLYGRIVHLEPVAWQDGWPLMGMAGGRGGGAVREPVIRFRKPAAPAEADSPGSPRSREVAVAPQANDGFDGPALGLQWQWNANHRDGWLSLADRPGYLRLAAQPVPDGELARAPGLLLQKLPARAFVAETVVELDPGAAPTRAGLVVMGKSHAALVVAPAAGGRALELVLVVDDRPVAWDTVGAGPVWLAVAMADGGLCRFAFATEIGADGVPPPGRARAIGGAFQAREGVWVGARVGLFAADAGARTETPTEPATATATARVGHADFEHFRFHPAASLDGRLEASSKAGYAAAQFFRTLTGSAAE